MQSLGPILWAVAIMALLNVLMVVMTVGVRAMRSIRRRREKARRHRLEAALEHSLFSDEVHPDLYQLDGRDLDLLAPMMVDYLALLGGAENERLAGVAEEAGLVERYHRMLRGRGRWRKAHAALNLGYFGGPSAVPDLALLLSHPDETVRAVAARALARIGTPEAAGALAETLNDPSELTRLRMAENLERIGPLAIGPLIETLQHGNPQARILAARILGYLRSAEARPALQEAMLDGSHTDLRAQATLAVGKVGNPDDVPALREAAKDEDWPVRAQAANALEMIGDTSSIPTLQDLTVDPEWWVRLNASRALANMGPEGERALARVLGGADRYARDRAVATLEERGVTRRVVDELAEPGERGESARAMIRSMIQAGATRYLGRLATTMPDGPQRQVLAGLLEDVGAREAGR